MKRWGMLLLTLCLLSVRPVWAVNPSEMLADPVLEERARLISKQVRCVVCQNESIDESNAELARDLRVVIRDQIAKGASDEQIFTFLVDRYGTFILLMPPFGWQTLILWVGPVALLVAGGGLAALYLRGRKKAPVVPPLSDEEKQRLAKLLNDGDVP